VPPLGQAPVGRGHLGRRGAGGDAQHLVRIDPGAHRHRSIVPRTAGTPAPGPNTPPIPRDVTARAPPSEGGPVLADLKKFLFKDSLIDVAVAFILATAFGLVVKSLVTDILMPIIAAIVGKPSFDDIVITLGDTPIKIGVFLTLFINFLIVGTVLFFIVRAIQRVTAGRKVEENTTGPSQEVVLLTEIRDALAQPRP
jgi:large conductance mechanosensitive channel